MLFKVLRFLWAKFTEHIGTLIRNVITPVFLPLVEMNLVPDFVIRFFIQRELEMELLKVQKPSIEEKAEITRKFVAELKTMPIAIKQDDANVQHYEVPDEFYQLVLGPRLKYSSGFWPRDNTTFAESEIAMLEMYIERAKIVDGMHIIDLGCGWGSVTLYLASRFPNAKITSISNSNSQREYIMGQAKQRGYKNVNVFTGDISVFDLPKEYYSKADRVISIEMFEHMKNYRLLMKKVSNWLKPEGKLFIHIFVSREVPGHYENGWMTENFFTGGTLPSDDLLLHFQEDLALEERWRVNGTHYQKTLEGWLQIMDSKKKVVMPLLAKTYGKDQALKRYVYWRLFFIACAEFFGMRKGQEYFVSHYLFTKPVRA